MIRNLDVADDDGVVSLDHVELVVDRCFALGDGLREVFLLIAVAHQDHVAALPLQGADAGPELLRFARQGYGVAGLIKGDDAVPLLSRQLTPIALTSILGVAQADARLAFSA